MPHVYTLEQNYEDIADAIRGKLGVQTTYQPSEMAAAIETIGGSAPTLQAKTVTPTASQQTVSPDAGYDGLSLVTVNAAPLTTKTATPTASSQTITPGTGYIGMSSVTVDAAPLTTQSATPSTSSQTITPSTGYIGLSSVTVNAIPSQYIVPSGTISITNNGTVDVTQYASAEVNVSGSTGKNIQAYIGTAETNATSYTATSVSLTVAKTGTYNISWTGARSTGSGTSGSQLYKNGSAVGTANTAFTRSYWQFNELTNQSLTQGDVLVVRARARGSSYYMEVGNLIIEEQ